VRKRDGYKVRPEVMLAEKNKKSSGELKTKVANERSRRTEKKINANGLGG